MKDFKKIKTGQLNEGIIKMLEYLNIAGSTSTYNIYQAVQREQDIAKKPDLKVFVWNSDKYNIFEAVCREIVAGKISIPDHQVEKAVKLLNNVTNILAKYQ